MLLFATGLLLFSPFSNQTTVTVCSPMRTIEPIDVVPFYLNKPRQKAMESNDKKEITVASLKKNFVTFFEKHFFKM
jgi:hypothetical protein